MADGMGMGVDQVPVVPSDRGLRPHRQGPQPPNAAASFARQRSSARGPEITVSFPGRLRPSFTHDSCPPKVPCAPPFAWLGTRSQLISSYIHDVSEASASISGGSKGNQNRFVLVSLEVGSSAAGAMQLRAGEREGYGLQRATEHKLPSKFMSLKFERAVVLTDSLVVRIYHSSPAYRTSTTPTSSSWRTQSPLSALWSASSAPSRR